MKYIYNQNKLYIKQTKCKMTFPFMKILALIYYVNIHQMLTLYLVLDIYL